MPPINVVEVSAAPIQVWVCMSTPTKCAGNSPRDNMSFYQRASLSLDYDDSRKFLPGAFNRVFLIYLSIPDYLDIVGTAPRRMTRRLCHNYLDHCMSMTVMDWKD